MKKLFLISFGSFVFMIIFSANHVVAQEKIPSPLTQLKTGVMPSDVKCYDGLELIFRTSNHYPVCVKIETKQKLIERGWSLNLVTKTIKIVNSNSVMNYTILGGELHNAVLDPDGYSLLLQIRATNDGQATIKVPNTFDPTDDYNLMAIVDGQALKIKVEKTSSEFIMNLQFLKDSEEIEIIAEGNCQGIPCSLPIWKKFLSP